MLNLYLAVIVTTLFLLPLTPAMAADPAPLQPRQLPQRNLQPLQRTPESIQRTAGSLDQQVAALQQQVQTLQTQVQALQSVIQITQQGTTIQAGNLSIMGQHSVTVNSQKDLHFSSGANLHVESGKNLSFKGGHTIVSEGASQLRLKAPLIILNDGNKPIALKDSPVGGGKVLSGSPTILAK